MVELVVLDHAVELARLLELAMGQLETLADLGLGLGRALGQAPVELGDRSADEDRVGARHDALHVQRSLGLQLEHADAPGRADPLQLGAESPVALARDVGDMLEELSGLDAGARTLPG